MSWKSFRALLWFCRRVVLRQGGDSAPAAAGLKLQVLPTEDSLLGDPQAAAMQQWAVAGTVEPHWVSCRL